ncbi:hypothetical protein M501DRAFT_998684 [Patellaria atrata CBS 101060]|uniref:Uncharacterized protein n=1 Tax=Patellaria atrata CBS 101060 TaxID=1346257 RepID=A0A9P4SGB3_9PEZI|nr:hypothetical protein M501DRAFT_998684 [Patellaria atrata CBS 101060]
MDGAMDDLSEMISPVTFRENSLQTSPTKSPSTLIKGDFNGSPQKSRSSPSKAKGTLSTVANKFKTKKEEDPANMSKEDKGKWVEKNRKRFRNIKAQEDEMIRKYNAENPLKK